MASLHKETAVNPNYFVRDISSLDHPDDCFCYLDRISETSNWDFYIVSVILKQYHHQNDLLLASSSLFPGNMVVSWMRAGATPFTVIPDLAYALASQ